MDKKKAVKAVKAIVSKLPRTYYDETPKTLQEVAERYAKNEKPRSTPQFNVKAKDLWPYREFDRPLKPELAESIKKEGIKQPLNIEIGPDGKYYVAEGNHRLKAMMESGLQESEVPVNIEFGIRDIGKKKLPGIKSELQSSDKSALSKGLNALSIPQKILMRKTAEAMGIDLGAETGEAGEDADKASEAIVEKAAQKLGIPEDSQLGAIGKAAAKTALDIGYDPLSLVPVGKIAKMTGKAKILPKILEKLGVGEKAAAKLPSMAERESAVLKQKLLEMDAQAKVDRLKRQRADVKWNALPESEKDKILEQKMHDELIQGMREKAASDLQNKRTRVGRNVEAQPWSQTPEGIMHESAAKEKSAKMLEDEKQAELSAATERAKQDIKTMRAAPNEDETQVIENPLKKLVKKVAKP